MPRPRAEIREASFLAALIVTATPQPAPASSFETYLNYIDTRPTEAQTPYAEECNGIAHDRDNWFIAQNVSNGKVWKIPVTVDLAGVPNCGNSGVSCNTVSSISQLSGYNHIGGIDHYQYSASDGFLVLSLEGSSPSIGILNGANLQYVSHQILPTPPGWSAGYSSCSWVAVDATGVLYTSSNSRPGKIQRFSVNWSGLASGAPLSLSYLNEFTLLDEFGALLDLGPQGGVLSPSGELLYLNNGYYESYNSRKDGISVIDMATKRRIAHSTRDGSEHFWYGYDPGGTSAEEPEGLTIWDLDADGRSPHSGQLHVLILDNDWPDDDDVYVRHYSEKIYVDLSSTGTGRGRPDAPFATVGEANTMAWDGCRILIQAGQYPEAITVSKRMEMIGRGGIVAIGP